MEESWPKKTIMTSLLITGHRGLLGSACCRVLKDKYKILTFEGDITDISLFHCWFRANKPDYVIHCAAKVGGVGANKTQPVDFLLQNLQIQDSIFRMAFDFKVKKLVFIGTSCLYPRDAPLPVSEESLLTGPFEPDVSAYSTAKLCGYEMVKAYHQQYGKNYMVVAPCNLFGLGDNYGVSAHVIPALMSRVRECMETNQPLIVWGDGSQVREFLYADDAALAIGQVLELWNKPDLINIGSGIGTRLQNLVELILGVSDAKLEVVWDRSKPTGIPNKTFNIRKITKLDWGPLYSLEEGLKITWEAFIKSKKYRNT